MASNSQLRDRVLQWRAKYFELREDIERRDALLAQERKRNADMARQIARLSLERKLINRGTYESSNKRRDRAMGATAPIPAESGREVRTD